MNMKDFKEINESMVEEEFKLLYSKGKEYSGDENTFRNFEETAIKLNIHPIKVLMIYYSKHSDSIFTFLKDFKVYSNEDITSRIMDARNYLAILYAMILKYRRLDSSHIWYIV